MTKSLLVDATQAEEVRVAVVHDQYLVDFDYESHLRKQIKGSIFLAKVTRVEPSLQAAFVNFGGNRHGFLPFSEIHPDYFRIPIADREALIEEQKAEMEALAKQEEELDDEGIEPDDVAEEEELDDEDNNKNKRGRGRGRKNSKSRDVEIVGGDVAEGEKPKRPKLKKNYKIQEVVKRGQIMLVQVQKEERGNKGAAVTSYLSLPGRYCVLMPNSPRGGGVSRKIANFKERRRMREILKELNVPDGMSVILRTAGVERTKTEIKRDLDYLMRLWDEIRNLTLESIAPACIYEEGSLVKRALRDIYTRDIDEIIISGKEATKEAKKIMKMLIPSHVKRVKEYTDASIPLFQKFQVETQIAQLSEPVAPLKSGGYIVINPTEALVAVDVNSGRATKERHIEETALRTNLESAEEVARQLKLRDLGGLIVIDFIDMEDHRNNTKVERRLKEALSSDRARIQIGRISNFGLLELSRQRLNPSVTESQFEVCGHCAGFGYTRTTDSAAVIALRAVEEQAIKNKHTEIELRIPDEVALYILNHKRAMLEGIEEQFKLEIRIESDSELTPGAFEILTDGKAVAAVKPKHHSAPEDSSNNNNNNNNNNNRRNKTKRGRRGGRGRQDQNNSHNHQNDDSNTSDENKKENNSNQKAQNTPPEHDDENKKENKNRNSSRNRNSRHKKPNKTNEEVNVKEEKSENQEATPQKSEGAEKKAAPKRGRKPNAKDTKKDEKSSEEKPKSKKTEENSPAPSNDSAPPQPKKNEEKKEEAVKKDYEVVNQAPKKKKKGWWSKG